MVLFSLCVFAISLFGQSDPETALASSNGAMFCATEARSGAFDTRPVAALPRQVWVTEEVGPVAAGIASNNRAVYIANTSGTLFSLSPANGEVNWSRSLSEGVDVSGPAVSQRANLLVAGTGANQVIALRASNGNERWHFNTQGRVTSSPVIADDGRTYFADEAGYLYAVDSYTGHLVWMVLAGTRIHSSPAVYQGCVYITTTDGYVIRFDAVGGEELWRTFVHRGIRSTTPLAEGLLFTTNCIDRVIALDAVTGAIRWEAALPVHYMTTPAVSTPLVYLVDALGYACALDISTGETMWRIYLGDTTLSPPVLARNFFYVCCFNGVVIAMDRHTGAEAWRLPLEGKISAQPSIWNRCLFVNTTKETYALLD